MDKKKKSFVMQYIRSDPSKITTWFNQKRFLDDININLRCEEKSVKNFLEYYTPWHQKDGIINGIIEEVLNDPDYRTIKIKDVLRYPEKKLEIEEKGCQLNKQISEIVAIPIATDINLNKTLILDSNKTVALLVQNQANLQEKVKVAEVYGEDLHNLIVDFKVISRSV